MSKRIFSALWSLSLNFITHIGTDVWGKVIVDRKDRKEIWNFPSSTGRKIRIEISLRDNVMYAHVGQFNNKYLLVFALPHRTHFQQFESIHHEIKPENNPHTTRRTRKQLKRYYNNCIENNIKARCDLKFMYVYTTYTSNCWKRRRDVIIINYKMFYSIRIRTYHIILHFIFLLYYNTLYTLRSFYDK